MRSKQTFPGDELRQAREALKLSLEEIYRQLHIPIRFVEALETSQFDQLPSSCYVIGFLKTYCQHLGLSCDRFVNSYQVCVNQQNKGFLRRTAGQASAIPSSASVLSWLTVLAILALGWISYTAVFRPTAEPTQKHVGAYEMAVPAPPSEDAGE